MLLIWTITPIYWYLKLAFLTPNNINIFPPVFLPDEMHFGAFINLFGPYYNLGDLLIQIRSKSAFYLNNSRPWHSNELAKSVLNKQLFNLIESQKEKNEIEILLKRKNVSALELAKLSPIAKNVFTVLKKEDQNELKEIFTNLSFNSTIILRAVFGPIPGSAVSILTSPAMRRLLNSSGVTDDNRIIAVLGPIPETPISIMKSSRSVSSENAKRDWLFSVT